ncbi:MAG: DUF1700 domain-containing protein [Bacilli bacterium]|nr:DUF1700 domain-containing protein [Bacilli bacterium]
MSKKEFLDKLRKRLGILNKQEIDDIIEEYEGHINEKVASGKTEEEAIKDFGDFDELVKEILSAYKINEDYESKSKERNVLTDFIDGCTKFIKDVSDNLSKRSKDDIIRFIVELIVLILFISILKLPVILIEKMGCWLFGMLINPFGSILCFIWKFMIEILYLILAVMAIVNFVKKRYLEGEVMETNKENTEKKKSEEEPSFIPKKEVKQKNTTNSSFTNVIMIIIKICLAFILIPAIFSFVGAFIALIIGIIMLCKGVPYFGVFLCILTYVLLNITFLDLCFRFIFNKKISLSGLLGSIIITVIVFSVGVALSFYEVVNTTYVNGVDDIIERREEKREITYTDKSKISCRNYYGDGTCNYVIDDSLGNKVIAEISYYDYLDGISFNDDLRYEGKENASFSLKKMFNIVMNDLKERRFHNYEKLDDVDVTITLSKEVLEKIKQKDRETHHYDYDNYEDELY